MPSKLAVAALALIIHLPLLETILYYPLLHRADLKLSGIWPQVATGLFIGWLLALPPLLVTRQMLKAALSRTRDWLAATLGDRIRKYWSSGTLLMLIPTLLLFMVLFRDGMTGVIGKAATSKLLEAAAMILLWGLVALLSWFVNWLLQHVRYTTPPDVSGALDDWLMSVRMSIPYYLFALGFAWYIARPSTFPARQQGVAFFSFAKDLVLIWVIGQILFVSVFHLKRAGKLLALFRSREGFLRFILTCAVVALIAIAADFHYLVSAQAQQIYPEEWQQDLMLRHTFLRDIGLLLLPIAGLLIWAVRGVGAEASLESRAAPAIGS